MKATLGNGLETLRGKLGPLCGKVIRGQQQIGRLSVPYSLSQGQPSSGQLDSREFYRGKIKEWQDASDTDRENWNAAAEPLNISGFNYLLTLMGAKWENYVPGIAWGGDDTGSIEAYGRFIVMDKVTFFIAWAGLYSPFDCWFDGIGLPTVTGPDALTQEFFGSVYNALEEFPMNMCRFDVQPSETWACPSANVSLVGGTRLTIWVSGYYESL